MVGGESFREMRFHAANLIGEGLKFTIERLIDEAAAVAGMQRDVLCDEETESVHGFLEVAVDVVHIDGAAAGRRTRILLGNEEKLVDGIVLDVAATVELLTARSGQCDLETGLGCESVKLDGRVVFGGGAENSVGGIDGDAVDKAKAETGELVEGALDEIGEADDGQAAKAAVAAAENGLIGNGVECHGRRNAAEIVGVGNVDDPPEGILRDVRLENIGDEVSAVVEGENRGLGRSLGGSDLIDDVLFADGRFPGAGECVFAERIEHIVGPARHVNSLDVLFFYETNTGSNHSKSYEVIAIGKLLYDFENFAGGLVEGLDGSEISAADDGFAEDAFGAILIDVVSENIAAELGFHDDLAGTDGRLLR